MIKFLKVKILALVMVLIFPVVSACFTSDLTFRTENLNQPSVNFLSVGQGDCAFIIFPDGKTMLIDCGEKSEENLNTICRYIDAAGGTEIDFLILSHTDSDHTGCAADVIKKYGVKRAYIPKVLDLSKYVAFAEAVEALDNCGAEKIISAGGRRYIADDYFFCFLYPDEDTYDCINYGDASAEEINSTSSVVYIDYCGVRFLFTGDATKASEEKVVEYGLMGLFNLYSPPNFHISLTEIDFFKVSHHGGKEEISQDFYSYVTPVNAVISVGANNKFGHPSIYTLVALQNTVSDINILRTDVLGSISVYINGNGLYKITTDAD